MDTPNKRAEKRIYDEIPVCITDRLNGPYSDAILFNHSKNGMYIESNSRFLSGSPLFIKNDTGKSPHGFISGKITWCQISNKLMKGEFGMGVYCTSDFIDNEHVPPSVVQCDRCGGHFLVDFNTRQPNSVYICRPCNECFRCLPNGDLRQSVENYLMGNVF